MSRNAQPDDVERQVDAAGEIVRGRFVQFLADFRLEDEDEDAPLTQRMMKDYEKQVASMVEAEKNTLYVDFTHVMHFDSELAEAIELEYYRFDPFLRHALQEFVAREHREYVYDLDKGTREFFVAFYNMPRVERIRQMRTDRVGRLIAISGTVTRSSEVRPELLYGTFSCRKCQHVHRMVEQQFQYTTPQVCRNPTCKHTNAAEWNLVMDESIFTDWQRLRVQENADEIPAGSMPRSVDVILRNEIVERAKAGDKVVFTGTVVVLPDVSSLSRAGESAVAARATGRTDTGDGVTGLKQLGVKELTYRMAFVACAVQHVNHRTGALNVLEESEEMGQDDILAQLSDAEKREIIAMRNTPGLYDKLARSIAPNVFGHDLVKKGVLLMLFGGVHKSTAEGIQLRGDINVCIVGDPSTAKSQFLKYVHGFLPRCVFTSGKASSAAGLTASVVKDSETGEFCVEAGALMLADNGICCIDEFDKMDLSDQVAIHEAMEQQTISITKAGIQATLNARTSILAAANPVYGRYDRTKTLKANVAISAPIMSRFDLFFVVLDECNPEMDENIARHIVDVHRRRARDAPTPFTTQQLQNYIRFARTLNPRITAEGRKKLIDRYRLLRQNDTLGRNKTAYRITVRQLESLIRLSEALARLHLDDEVKPQYVDLAYQLMEKSIITVEMAPVDLEFDLDTNIQQLPGETAMAALIDGGGVDDEASEAEQPTMEQEETDVHDHNNSTYVEEDADGADHSSSHGEDEHQHQQQPQQQQQRMERSPKRVRQRDDKKQKTQISFEEYNRITQMLLFYLRTQDERHDMETGDFPGVRWRDLVAWYLQQLESEITSTEEFDRLQKLVTQVIKRMIKHEQSIIVLESEDGQGSNEDKFLKIHPGNADAA